MHVCIYVCIHIHTQNIHRIYIHTLCAQIPALMNNLLSKFGGQKHGFRIISWMYTHMYIHIHTYIYIHTICAQIPALINNLSSKFGKKDVDFIDRISGVVPLQEPYEPVILVSATNSCEYASMSCIC
jgi:hypothetical protein